jgi:glycosyl transferase family 87
VSASAPFPQVEPVAPERFGPLEIEDAADERPGILTLGETWAYLGALAALVIVNVPTLGTEQWPFHPGPIEPEGPFAPVVRMARNHWDPGLLRSLALLAGVIIALYAVFAARASARRLGPLIALSAIVLGLLVLPAVVLQAGLRDSTAPWFFTNDSTYQIELAGDAVANGENPYGHEYGSSGLERFYTMNGTVGRAHVAEEHFAYFPGTALTASVWRVLPSPWNDYRLLVALATLGAFFAVLAFRAPLGLRLALGALVVANPLAIRAAWFGNADAPSILFLLLAFALVTRSRYTAGAVLLAAAVLLKQFALVAVPFVALIVLIQATRREALRAAAAFLAVAAAGLLPFVIADPSAFWADTVTYGVETYTIVGYGLAAMLVRVGLVENRNDDYPFGLLALLVWLPVTLILLRAQWRSREPWIGAAGFALSIFLLIFIGRVFHSSYLVWPLAGAVLAALVALPARIPVLALPAPSRPEVAPTRRRLGRSAHGRRASRRE